jgi:hypothetical protein
MLPARDTKCLFFEIERITGNHHRVVVLREGGKASESGFISDS